MVFSGDSSCGVSGLEGDGLGDDQSLDFFCLLGVEGLDWLGEGVCLRWLEGDFAFLGEDWGDVAFVGDGRLLGEDQFVDLCPLGMEGFAF